MIFSARYDLTILAPYLLPELQERYGKVNILKKDNDYLSVSCEDFVFKDILKFSSPVSLSTYLKQNNIKETKTIFPYTAFSSIEEMEAQIEFPPHEAFYSDLKGSNVSAEEYQAAKSEYERRLYLPTNHPDKIHNFKGWLLFYNNLDTAPLASAIDASFGNFFEIFKMDPAFCISLPGYAQKCQFAYYDDQAPFSYSFATSKQDEIRELFRRSLYGGLVNCFSRMTDLTNQPNLARSAQFAANGDRFTRICFFDFNGLYLWAQRQAFPTTPGIAWEPKINQKTGHKFFSKRIMTSQTSLEAVQWLMYLQETSYNGVQIQHKFFRGEVEINEWPVDGYVEINGEPVFMEYLGCYWHPECPHGCGAYPTPSNQADRDRMVGKVQDWDKKSKFLKSRGKLITIRGCQWRKQLREGLKNYHIPSMPRIMDYAGSEKIILDGIKSGKLFGFVVADVMTPSELLDKILPLNFPPIIIRGEITEEMLSEYMSQRVKAKGIKLPQTTLLQRYHANQVLLMTPVAKFYMDLGMKLSNVTKFLQYQPEVVLKPFVKAITEGRIKAKKADNPSLELAYKIIGNR